MSTLLESILRNVKITNEILGTAAAPPDASYTVKGISKKYTTAQQLQDSIDNSENLDFVVSGQAIASVVSQVTSATEQLTELQEAMSIDSTSVSIVNTTASTSTTTGALIVSGGVGIAGAISAASASLTTPLTVASGGTGLTSLTAGYIPFGNGTSALNTNANLFWDNTNARLGVNTSQPTIAFQTKVASNTNIGFTTRGANISAISSFNDAGSGFQNLHIDGTFISLQGNSNGNVGINTIVNNGYKLDVNGTAIFRGKTIIGAADINNSTLAVNQDGANSEFYVGTNSVSNTQRLFISQARRSNYGDMMIGLNLTGQSGSDAFVTRASGGGYSGINFSYDGNIDFYATTVATTNGATVTPTSRININGTSGNVSIGTTNSFSKLTIQADDSSTTFGGNLTQVGLNLINSNATNNNWSTLLFSDNGSAPAVLLGVQHTDHTNNYGRFSIGTRGSGGFGQRFTIDELGVVSVLSTTASTSTTTGSLVTAGGLGVAGAGYFGNVINANSGIVVPSGTGISYPNWLTYQNGVSYYIRDVTNGVMLWQMVGGTSVSGSAILNGTLTVNGTTSSTNTTTGALVVSGGVGIAGALYTGAGIVNTTGSMYLPNNTSIYFRNSANSAYLRALRFASDDNFKIGEDSNITYLLSNYIGIGTGSVWSKLTIGGGNVTLLNNISIQGVNAAGSTFYGLIKVGTDDRVYINENNRETIMGGKTGFGINPTAVLHLKAGTATANTAPLKFTTSGAVLLTTPEAGVLETDGTDLFFTNNAGVRKTVTLV